MPAPLLRTSERKDFRRCPWLWEQSWLNGLTPTRRPTWSVFGTAYHRAMEVRYCKGTKRGSVEEAIEVFLDSLDEQGRKVGLQEEEEEPEEDEGGKRKLVPAKELGPIMLREHAKLYGDDREWEVIHTEQPFQINVPKPGSKRTLVVYAGTWDVLMRNRRTKRFWLWDWKTCKSLPRPDYLDIDDQAGSYIWVAKRVLVHKGIFSGKERIEGIVFDYSKKALPDSRPVDAAGRALNQDGSISKKQPAARFLRHATYRSPAAIVAQAQRVQKEAVVMKGMREGTLPIYKNPTMECGRCVLWDMCTAHEQGDDWELIRDTLYTKRDPYADHRADMERNGIEL